MSAKFTVADLEEIISVFPPDAVLRFSVANDSTPDPGTRWFVENGVHDFVLMGDEVTLCLVGESNDET